MNILLFFTWLNFVSTYVCGINKQGRKDFSLFCEEWVMWISINRNFGYIDSWKDGWGKKLFKIVERKWLSELKCFGRQRPWKDSLFFNRYDFRKKNASLVWEQCSQTDKVSSLQNLTNVKTSMEKNEYLAHQKWILKRFSSNFSKEYFKLIGFLEPPDSTSSQSRC